jgi:hypothetical protein
VAADVESRCTSCGVSLAPATSYLSERGAVCASCLARVENELDRAHRNAAELEVSLTRRGRVLAGSHWVMWSVATILAAQWVPLSRPLAGALLLGVAALAVALVLRVRWAYPVALALDTAGALAVFAWAALGRSGSGLIALVALFPISLVVLTRVLRAAYEDERELAVRPAARLRGLIAGALAAVVIAGAAAYVIRRKPPDPVRELMRAAVPAWQAERGRPNATAAGPAARDLLARTRPWPALTSAFEALDRVWPDDSAVHVSVRAVNQALAEAGLPYFLNTYPIGDRPFVLSYALDARAAWHVGNRSVDVLRLRRLDTLNVELGLFGSTEGGLPVVMLDRIEAMLTTELPAMYGQGAAARSDRNAFDRAALDRTRVALEARVGPGLATAAAALGERARLVEQMRTRLHGGDVHLALPDGFVLGDDWFERIEPEARLDRPGGPLVLDTDLREVAKADKKLRDGAVATSLRAAVDVMALTTEAHEARHALDEIEPVGPPPPALFEVMPDSSTAMIGMADKELRAILGELHDAALPACVALAAVARNVHGKWARRNPHFFATLVILRQLDPDSDLEPAEQLAMLCAVPDPELRRRLAAAWQTLYGAPMPQAERARVP